MNSPTRLDPLATPVLARLRELALQDRLPQSLLLEGPEGSAKEAAALELARLLQCERPGGEPCAALVETPCAACRKSRGLAHPDSTYVCPVQSGLSKNDLRQLLEAKAADPLARVRQPSSAIVPIGSADDPAPCSIREVRRFVGLKPYEGSARAVVVGDAHRMNRSAANALLKTLEEPPPAAQLILCTHQPHLLLTTIRSRCTRVRVPALDPDRLAGHLQGVHDLSAAEAARVTAVSGCNARRALDLVDPDARALADWADELMAMLAARDTAALLLGADRVAKGQPPRGGKAKTKASGDASLAAGRDVGIRVLDFLTADLVQLARLSQGAQVAAVQRDRLERVAASLGGRNLAAMAQQLMAARADLAANVNVGLVLTSVFRSISQDESPSWRG